MDGKLKYFLWSASTGRLGGDRWLISDLASLGSSYRLFCCYYILILVPEPLSWPHPPSAIHFWTSHYSAVSRLVHQLVVLTQKGLWMYERCLCYSSSVALTNDSLSVFYGWRRLRKVIRFRILRTAAGSRTSLSSVLNLLQAWLVLFLPSFSGAMPTLGRENGFLPH